MGTPKRQKKASRLGEYSFLDPRELVAMAHDQLQQFERQLFTFRFDLVRLNETPSALRGPDHDTLVERIEQQVRTAEQALSVTATERDALVADLGVEPDPEPRGSSERRGVL